MRVTRTGYIATLAVSVAVVLGCHDATGPKIGVLRISAVTTGIDVDPDGYKLIIDRVQPGQQVALNGVLAVLDLSTGEHIIQLTDLSVNCSLASPSTIHVNVVRGVTTEIEYAVTCVPYLGTLRIATQSDGQDVDDDGYLVEVDASPATLNLDANSVAVVPKMPAGLHRVVLSGIARNCVVDNGTDHWVSITPGETTEEVFVVKCSAFANLRVRTVTTGLDPDPNGYQLRAWSTTFEQSLALPANGTVDISKILGGTYKVAIAGGIAVNCDSSDPATRTVSVASGATEEVVLQFTCTRAMQLAYVSADEGRDAIYVMSANGTGLARLSADNVAEGDPSWSPDGSKIAFWSLRDGNSEIYVMSASGSDAVRLTTATASDYDPVWSPDGSRIAFVSDRDGQSEIYVMHADGSGLVRLTNNDDHDADPSWSPDGRKIAFSSNRDGNSEIYTMNADGSGVVRLTKNDSYDGEPDWSPDGAKIAFTSEGSCDYDYYYYYDCFRNIYVMNADGTGATQLVSDSYDASPTWSPDGRWIAFATWQGYDCSCSGVSAIRPDGTDRREILAGAASKPAWRR
jgi:WD40 repeat protein